MGDVSAEPKRFDGVALFALTQSSAGAFTTAWASAPTPRESEASVPTCAMTVIPKESAGAASASQVLRRLEAIPSASMMTTMKTTN